MVLQELIVGKMSKSGLPETVPVTDGVGLGAVRLLSLSCRAPLRAMPRPGSPEQTGYVGSESGSLSTTFTLFVIKMTLEWMMGAHSQ